MVSPSHLLPFLSSTTLWLDTVSNPSIHEDICQHTSIFYMVPTSLLSFQGSSCSPTPLAPWFSLLSHWWRKLKLTLSLLFLILIHGIICVEDLFFFYCLPWYPICQSCHVMSMACVSSLVPSSYFKGRILSGVWIDPSRCTRSTWSQRGEGMWCSSMISKVISNSEAWQVRFIRYEVDLMDSFVHPLVWG